MTTFLPSIPHIRPTRKAAFTCSFTPPLVLRQYLNCLTQNSALQVSSLEKDVLDLLSWLSSMNRQDGLNADTIVILSDCILPRIEMLQATFGEPEDEDVRPCLSNTNATRISLIDTDEYERRIRHIKLMLNLVKNRESFVSAFWAAITRWQVTTYQRSCIDLLEDYRNSTRHMSKDNDEINVVISALEKAVHRACALPVPDPDKAQMSDAFSVRSIGHDPDVKALLDSEWVPFEKRLKIQQVAEAVLQQQPMFPPECYAVFKD